MSARGRYPFCPSSTFFSHHFILPQKEEEKTLLNHPGLTELLSHALWTGNLALALYVQQMMQDADDLPPPLAIEALERRPHNALGHRVKRPRIEQSCLDWNGGCAELLAEFILHTQRYSLVPLLGEALYEAGCRESVILDHCRQPMGHNRSCWLLQLTRSF